VKEIVYDAGVLLASDRKDRTIWVEHKARLERGILPIVPSPVVAQVSRSSRQVQLRRMLAGCVVAPLSGTDAHEAGALLGSTRTRDVVDAVVVTVAARNNPAILTSDAKDIRRLRGAAKRDLTIIEI
jgi:hypothetical protein